MSALIYREYKNTTAFNYRNDELKSVPEHGIPVFLFLGEKKGDGKTYKDAIDRQNAQRVYTAFNFRRFDKFDNKTVASVKSIEKGNGGFIDNRVKEKALMYDELVHLFLTYLNKALWNKCDKINGYVESTIPFKDAYDSVKTGMDAFRIVLEQIIDDKYPEKYSQAEVNNARKENALNISEKIGKINK